MVLRKGGACFSTWSQLCFCLDVPTPSTWSVYGSPLTHSRQLSQQALIPCCHRSGMLKSRPLHCARIANCPGPLWTDCRRQQGSNTTVAHIWHACAQCLVPHSLSENTIEQIQRLLLHSDLPVHCWTECSMTATPSVIPVMMNTTIHQKGMHLVTLAITTHWCEARGEILALEIEKVHE